MKCYIPSAAILSIKMLCFCNLVTKGIAQNQKE